MLYFPTAVRAPRGNLRLAAPTISGMNPRHPFTIALGLLLLVEGIWGLFNPLVFGVLATNTLHAIIHVALGIAGLWAGWAGRSRGYLLFVGILLLAVGLLWFVPGPKDLIVRMLNVNQAVAWVNIAVGIVSLLLARRSSPVRPATRNPSVG